MFKKKNGVLQKAVVTVYLSCNGDVLSCSKLQAYSSTEN